MPTLRATHGFAPGGEVWVDGAMHSPPRAAQVSARIGAAELQRFVAARLPALVFTTQCGTHVILDFIGIVPEHQTGAPNVLSCDAIDLGSGQARLWVEGRTLHIRAHNIDVMAHGEQRLRGATVHVG